MVGYILLQQKQEWINDGFFDAHISINYIFCPQSLTFTNIHAFFHKQQGNQFEISKQLFVEMNKTNTLVEAQSIEID